LQAPPGGRRPFRRYTVGEYGERNDRPHYHLLLFSDDSDFLPFSQQLSKTLWTSEVVEKKWKKGYCPVGRVEWDSIGYVSRYALKKRYGMAGEVFYEGRKREFATQSRRPPIGRRYFEKYWQEMYPRDEVVVNGRYRRPPVRYDKWLQGIDHDLWERVQEKRLAAQRPDPTPHELGIIEYNQAAARRRFTEGRSKI